MAIGKFIVGELKSGKEFECVPGAKPKTPPNIQDMDAPMDLGRTADTVYFIRDNGEVWLLKNRHGPSNKLLAIARSPS